MRRAFLGAMFGLMLVFFIGSLQANDATPTVDAKRVIILFKQQMTDNDLSELQGTVAAAIEHKFKIIP
ncbi:MAG TPA: hypothetical protein VJI13_03760, partial [Candidatus Norongarragalinales archaeon]|nr:hypothetical protein [Candidatus Norongarragalinales archaeon]